MKRDGNQLLTGRITNKQGAPLAGLIVRAYDKDFLTADDLLGEAVTDQDGRYGMEFRRGPGLSTRDVVVRITAGAKLVGEGRLPPDPRFPVTLDLQIDYAAPEAEEPPRAVFGTVRDQRGRPVANTPVKVLDRDLRSDQLLGNTRTDHGGAYRVEYFGRQFRRAEKGGADLVVQALASNGASVLASSEVLFNAPAEANVDLRIPDATLLGPTLFESLSRALPPLIEELAIADLQESAHHKDITFLSGETGFGKRDVARFVLAHKLARRELQEEFWFVLLNGSIFEFKDGVSLEDQLKAVEQSFAGLDEAAVRKAIASGINLRDIPASLATRADAWVEAFLSLTAKRALDDDAVAAKVLEDAGVKDGNGREAFARLYNRHRTVTPAMLEALGNERLFTKEQAADIRASLELVSLAQGDFPVARAIKQKFQVRRADQIRSLARKSDADWLEFVQNNVASGVIQLPAPSPDTGVGNERIAVSTYARVLGQRFRDAFPTAAFAGGLQRSMDNGGARGIRHPEQVMRFLDRYEDFEFLNTNIDRFLAQHTDNGRPSAAPELVAELKAAQRVFKVAQNFEATDRLLAGGLHSAQKIYRMGESEFVRRYAKQPGFDDVSARKMWNRAADTHAFVLTLVGDLKALDPEALPNALKKADDDLSTFPNWKNLFQGGDLCECEHCRSVLSPAAYFADILMFLKDRKSTIATQTVKDILFARRPDLGYLELNCENALTPLPYIDVVCEVLEDAVAGGENDIELPGFAAMPASNAAARAAVEAALNAQGISLDAGWTLSQVSPSDPNKWVAHASNVTYLLKKKGTPNFFAEVLRNTKASAEELRAYPQYVNVKAWDKLKIAKHPLGLPFDLFGEEVRAAFQKAGLKRWDLMDVFRGPATDGDIAREYFGIGTDPILVADATIAGQQDFWGVSGPGWLADVGRVSTFLKKTGLEYNELLALLDLKYINPASDIIIHHEDASCDLDKKVLQVLDEFKLDRLNRFLRLWRKLPRWKMWELDLAIRRVGGGNLNEAFLIQLQRLVQVKERLGPKFKIEQVIALFGDLNNETRFTKLHEKREDAHYQNLFLNKRLINPLDKAFIDLPAGETITGHRGTVLAALGIRETDFAVYKGLTKASDGLQYINDDLTLANLSFLWRHSWLARLLKLKAEEWKTVLELFQQDVLAFANPQAAWEFIQKIDVFKAAGFSVDELNWILAADLSAKAAVKETDAARFLTALRQQLQAVNAEFGIAPPPDEQGLTALLMSLLQKLDRTEAEAADFIATLNGSVVLEAPVDDLGPFAFPASITGAPNHIPIQYDAANHVLRIRGQMTEAQRNVLAGVSPDPSYGNAIASVYDQSVNGATGFVRAEVGVVLPGGVVLPPNMPSLPVHYNSAADRLAFSGLMTDAERIALNTAGNPAAAIDELFRQPRLAVKFYDTRFTAPLDILPAAIDFKAQVSPEVAAKIAFDAERRSLQFDGFMSAAEQAELNALVPAVLPEEIAYHAAVNSLAAQPLSIPATDERVWLSDADLDFSLPANDTLLKRFTKAVTRALTYLVRTRGVEAVLRQCSAQLGLTEAVTERLFTSYALLPDTVLAHLTGTFAASSGAVTRPAMQNTFDAWYWANRVALPLRKWNLKLPELELLQSVTAVGQLLDWGSLPLNDTLPVAPMDRFLRTASLIRLRDTLPETGITVLEVLAKLNSAGYSQADFAADLARLNENWPAAEAGTLLATINLAFPAGYLLAENLERVRRAFYYLDKLNAGVAITASFGQPVMTFAHAQSIKSALRSKFGEETWLTLSAEIQDVLREKKRDALAAYLLARPKPADAPSGKWENTTDLYAYYLLDVEMGSCMLTSRLVQGSGSVQLFVQRCFLGIEPTVTVQADGDNGDTAWRWWKWMRKYRVWEANRKVFLWPEQWIEPELKKDRSSFFKDLENELQQNEINQFTAEKAFTNYLEKLHGVAQLEIAALYQEDDADQTIVHVFGRTGGAEPHNYYYRRFDFRQWTPWEKIDLDIQGDYLIPAVLNRRLFLFWPVFTEVPDEVENSRAKSVTLKVNNTPTTFDNDKPYKRLRLQMAVSDYQQGRWTPKRVSTDFDQSHFYNVATVKRHYEFEAIDGSSVNGRFTIEYSGSSLDAEGHPHATLGGTFEIANCKGVPARTHNVFGFFRSATRPEWESSGDRTTDLKWLELEERHDPDNDFTLQTYVPGLTEYSPKSAVLWQTPWLYGMTPPWHLTYFDKLWLDGKRAFPNLAAISRLYTPLGTWAPYFYNDKSRTFFVLPATGGRRRAREGGYYGLPRMYYPELKNTFRQMEDIVEGILRTWLDGIDLTVLTSAQRQTVDVGLFQAFPDEAPPPAPGGNPPPYTPEQAERVKVFLLRLAMRFWHWFFALSSNMLLPWQQHHFKNHYHPFVCDFAKLVYNPLKGIPALMGRETQLKNTGFDFASAYQPTGKVVDPGTDKYYPKEVVDFDPDGAYAPYNWELFYHAPLLIANVLSRNQRFEEAREWYHFIFNPVGVASPVPGGSPASKYWITKPFFETTTLKYTQQRIENIMLILAGDTSAPGYSAQLKTELEAQVRDWRTNPFEPHRIANYRTVAYQKTVVMRYLDNLIAWGDYLFRQDSIESINEATQLYIMAAEILGPRPRNVPPQVKPPVESFNELEDQFDAFSNALVEVEDLVPPMLGDPPEAQDPAPLPMLYFCIPHNEKMLAYWETVADRLYKIRHCMNIEGVVRQLSLFEPPIDPAALVKAVAGGLDIGAALADLNAPLPLYRFHILLQKANEVCGDVKSLGSALLVALEKRDAEAMALLRQQQEIRVLEAVLAVREEQVKDAKEALNTLKRTKRTTEEKRNFYRDIERITSQERLQLDKLSESHTLQEASQAVKNQASVISILPAIDIGGSGFGGSPVAKFKLGGLELGQAASLAADVLSFLSMMAGNASTMAGIKAGFDRRWNDWKQQERLADRELDQIDSQIAGAEIRIAIAGKELENQKLQIENAKAIDAFMRSKYTNQELYTWQIGQISGVYFQSYRLAYDLAKRAERCMRFELGLQDSSYINFGYWDSLKKGLLCGEKLQFDLRRMEAAYMEQNRREFETGKSISLAQLDPLALIRLRETGRCFFRLPEEIFDLDFPGHYFRRIKSVSISLPCIVGPHTSIACTLRLLKNSIRINTLDGDNGYPRNTDDAGLPAEDSRFIESNVPVKAIAAGSAQNDSGVFELNFRDDRYLPFEGAGVISEWSLELFHDLPANNPDPSQPDFGKPLRQFDYATVSDAVMQIKLMSREDAGPFKNGAIAHLRDYWTEDQFSRSMRMIDMRQEFPLQWHRFLNPANPAAGNVLQLDISPALFRVFDENKDLNINSLFILARCTGGSDYRINLTLPDPPPAPGADQMNIAKVNQYGGLHYNRKDMSAWGITLEAHAPAESWSLRMTRDDGTNLQTDPVTGNMEVQDMWLILGYDQDVV